MVSHIKSNVRLDSVPGFLHRHLDRGSKRRMQSMLVEEERDYLKFRSTGRVPLRMAQKYMRLTDQGLGTYTDEADVAWYRDGEHIVRVTDDLSWLDSIDKARTSRCTAGQGSTEQGANTTIDNANDSTSLVSSEGDYELPQERSYNTAPPRKRKKK